MKMFKLLFQKINTVMFSLMTYKIPLSVKFRLKRDNFFQFCYILLKMHEDRLHLDKNDKQVWVHGYSASGFAPNSLQRGMQNRLHYS